MGISISVIISSDKVAILEYKSFQASVIISLGEISRGGIAESNIPYILKMVERIIKLLPQESYTYLFTFPRSNNMGKVVFKKVKHGYISSSLLLVILTNPEIRYGLP